MKKIAYVAGAMSGFEDFNRAAFFNKTAELNALGYTVLNPAILPDGLTQHHYMDICVAMVRSCDCIVMLDGWESSKGAITEFALAEKLGKAIYDERVRLMIRGANESN